MRMWLGGAVFPVAMFFYKNIFLLQATFCGSVCICGWVGPDTARCRCNSVSASGSKSSLNLRHNFRNKICKTLVSSDM